jgi:hypothetical protein
MPLLARLDMLRHEVRARTLPKSPLGDALGYLDRQWVADDWLGYRRAGTARDKGGCAMTARRRTVLGLLTLGVLLGWQPSTKAKDSPTYLSVAIQGPDDRWVDPLCCGQSGGVIVTATSPVWFGLKDLDGGSLWDGDVVVLYTQGLWGTGAFSVAPYSGEPVATTHNESDSEKFRIWSGECHDCEIPSGLVYFQSVSSGKFWIAVSCGGGDLNATSTSPGSYCNRFEISR